jgi:hypothetical protein
MNYSQFVKDRFFFDFVFYETSKDRMYTFCPNCGFERQHIFKDVVPKGERKKVQWIKEHYSPCVCFDFKANIPKYLRSDHSYNDLNRTINAGEFVKRTDGSVSFIVYNVKASFGANYYYDSRPFYRIPHFSREGVTVFDFKESKKCKIKTRCYIPMYGRSILIGDEWRACKSWRVSFQFEVIEESFKELKGTFLEKYIPDIIEFGELVKYRYNLPLSESVILFLIKMTESHAFNKLWRAGFKTICFSKIISYLLPNNFYATNIYGGYSDRPDEGVSLINWSAKKLETILKVSINELDNLEERKEVTCKDIRLAKKLQDLKIQISHDNMIIADTYRLNGTLEMCTQKGISSTKLFKYIRHLKHTKDNEKFDYNVLVSDYSDYLEAVIDLKEPLTKDVLFPSHFRAAHDRAVQLKKQQYDTIINRKFIDITKKYKKLTYHDDKYVIFAVSTFKMLKREAFDLHNCSAGYYGKILSNSSALFLIRTLDAPTKPLYMLELNPRTFKIIQNRGFKNEVAPDEVREFADKWQTDVVFKNTKFITDKIAEENYI